MTTLADQWRQGFQFTLSDGRHIIARLANGDVNVPRFGGLAVGRQAVEIEFETAVQQLVHPLEGVPISDVLYSRVPVQHELPRDQPPKDVIGRRLIVSERTEGRKVEFVWKEVEEEQKLRLLSRGAAVRAALFDFQVPPDFTSKWFLHQLFTPKPDQLPMPVASTRQFCLDLLSTKIEATIKNIGDMIGWEDDHEVVGPRAFAAKASLLRLIPHILPPDDGSDGTYRLVLEHGDFGTHNMLVKSTGDGDIEISSLFDRETGCMVPALLSDPEMKGEHIP